MAVPRKTGYQALANTPSTINQSRLLETNTQMLNFLNIFFFFKQYLVDGKLAVQAARGTMPTFLTHRIMKFWFVGEICQPYL